jgi:fibronectin-binding autotransporter adhesin
MKTRVVIRLAGVVGVLLAVLTPQASRAAAITWNGTLSGVWDVNTTANWAGSVLFNNGDTVTFNDSASGTTTIVVDGGGVTPGSMTANNTTKTYDISGGAIGGTGGLTKSGTGSLTLSGVTANTFNGSVAVNDGTLILNKTAGVNAVGGNTITVGDGTGLAGSAIVRLAQSDQIPNAAIVEVRGDGLFDLNGNNETIAGLNLAGVGGQVSTGAGRLTMTNQYIDDRAAGGGFGQYQRPIRPISGR